MKKQEFSRRALDAIFSKLAKEMQERYRAHEWRFVQNHFLG